MVLWQFRITILDEQRDNFRMFLEKLDNVRVVRSLSHADTVIGVLDFHLNFIRVGEDFPEQRVSHANRIHILHAIVHGFDIVLFYRNVDYLSEVNLNVLGNCCWVCWVYISNLN